ncbi:MULTISPECIES: sodium:alanine symporter family protein [unclassified Eubacterium (in: firmicutes)]|uniref:alanine/glycine:cation symporter family protein n=1 Tax=unclassified Eubacterium (in: firmicutes) TaxID=2624479 RepID=UPI000E51AFFA|nr:MULTISPECIES: sodium:alanine symporter family protein [unclassified Eubacterium (in: firmicutes)]RGF52940.1 sodium:alanine symporter family protein [Eubacterium sp. AF36-5BH]RHP22782.1 sodium:alanine symporter family protein [Eubacterium sp. AF34-35BH]
MDWKSVGNWISDTLVKVDDFVWGPVMLVLLVGTGIFLTIRLKFRPWRNLGFAIKSTLSKEARTTKRGEGDVSPFSALTTALAATIGTGNIVGVATAMVSGGPGALVWMWISACFGLTSKFSECMLAIKYREVNEKGEMSGGPMYTMKKGFKNKKIGAFLGMLFAVFAVIASFGIGNMTQANSISESLKSTFNFDEKIVGVVLTVLALVIIVGGIKTISKVSSIVVPLMAIFYIIAGLIVVVMNIQNLPSGIVMIFKMAFSSQAVAGGGAGVITAGVMNAMRYGVARGVFSNEAGMGSAAITASAATTDDPVRQGYINMTGTFWDTIVVCTITGLCIASSGVLGTVGDDGELVQGAALTILAFKSALGEVGAILVTIGIALFAFSTILGWEYHGEKAFEYIFGTHKYNMAYRIIFSLVVFVGATTTLQVVWNFSDIANALMAIPNLICLLVMSKVIAKEVERFQPILDKEKKAAKKKK